MSCDLLRIKSAQKTKASAFKDLLDLKETGDQLVYRDPQGTRGNRGRGVKQERKEKRVTQVRDPKLKCTIYTRFHITIKATKTRSLTLSSLRQANESHLVSAYPVGFH